MPSVPEPPPPEPPSIGVLVFLSAPPPPPNAINLLLFSEIEIPDNCICPIVEFLQNVNNISPLLLAIA